MPATTLDLVVKNIEATRDSISRALIDGAAADYAAYRAMCGEIRGLSLACSYIEDLVRKMEQDDE
jgi:hypothetical protein